MSLDLTLWKPRPFYHVVDLGMGKNPKRLVRYASQHGDWSLLGVDFLHIYNLPRTVDLVKGDAVVAIQRLGANSVGSVYSDYFLHCLKRKDAISLLTELRLKMIAESKMHFIVPRKLAEMTMEYVNACTFKLSPITEAVPTEIELSIAASYHLGFVNAVIASQSGNEEVPICESYFECNDKYWKNPELLRPMSFTARVT